MLIATSALPAMWGVVSLALFAALGLSKVLQGICFAAGFQFACVDFVLNWIGQTIMSCYEFIARCCLLVARPIGRWILPGFTDVDTPVSQDYAQARASDPVVPETAARTAEIPSAVSEESAQTVSADFIQSRDVAPIHPSQNWSPYNTRPN